MSDSTNGVELKCGTCGKDLSAASYYLKDGKATCITCSLASVIQPGLRDDSALKQACEAELRLIPGGKDEGRSLVESWAQGRVDAELRGLAADLLAAARQAMAVPAFQKAPETPEEQGRRLGVLEEVQIEVSLMDMVLRVLSARGSK